MKRLFVLALCAVLLISMVGCGNNAQENSAAGIRPTEENPTSETQPTDEEPTAQANWFLTQFTEDRAASVELPDFVMEDENLKQLICDYINSRLDDCGCDFSLALSNEDVTAQPQDYLYYLDLDCRISYISDEIASVIFEGMHNVKTAAHPTHMFFTLNINRTTNERIKIHDVLPVNEALYAAFVLCAYESLAEKANEDWLAGIEITDLCSQSSFYHGLILDEEDAYAYFTETGLGISYAVPFALSGHQETEIPYSVMGITSLEEVLKVPSKQVSLYDGRFVFKDNGNYTTTYIIYDKNGVVLDTNTGGRNLDFIPLTETLLYVGGQAGTGVSTSWGYFYDFETDTKSETFGYVTDYTESLVVCGGERSVTVRSIFDDSYYLELTQFQYPLPPRIIEPIWDAKLSDDGKTLMVTYFTGEVDDYEKVTQEFALY